MKRSLRIKWILLLIMIYSCLACNKSDSVEQVRFDFAPAFNRNCSFIVDLNRHVLEFGGLNIKGNMEGRIKSYPISSETITVFKSQLRLIELDSTLDHSRALLDGTSFRVCKILNNEDTICLTTNSPRRNSKFELEYLFLDAFFELANNTIKDYESLCYLEYVQDCFDYNLPIKKISNNPIEYRVWGSVFGDERDYTEFIHFLKGLPIDKPIIFDVRNGSFAEKANRILETYNESRPLYFYGYNGFVSIKELREYELGQLKKLYKHPEFYGYVNLEDEVEKRLVENWRTVGPLKSFRTKQNLLDYLITID